MKAARESSRPLGPPGRGSDARAFLAEAIAQRRPGRVLVVDLPAPRAAVDRLLFDGHGSGWPAGSGLLWEPARARVAFAGVDVAVRLRARGQARFEEIRRCAEQVWRRVERRGLQPGAPPPVFCGGFSFAIGGAGGRWRELGEATFTLPRWRYARSSARAWISFCSASPDESADRAVAELEQITARLEGAEPPLLRAAPALLERSELSERKWARWVNAALTAIRKGAFEKLVLSRVTQLCSDRPIELDRVLRNLAGDASGATRFAFCERAASFAGLTPERLVALRGARVLTHALAGTSAPGGDLLASPKDRFEHDAVRRDIEHRLAPLCDGLTSPTAPAPRRFRHLVHLETPISGRARRGAHVLDLVAALHPTPAVAGLPSAAAVEWIGGCEDEPRGWYAGPVGWFDARGKGEFAVAIRSALISRSAAWLHAGAGIVPGSNAAAEYAETALKQRALLRALGAVP